MKNEVDLYWADDYEWHPEKNMDKRINWILAKNIKWQEVNDCMGKQNRYGIGE